MPWRQDPLLVPGVQDRMAGAHGVVWLSSYRITARRWTQKNACREYPVESVSDVELVFSVTFFAIAVVWVRLAHCKDIFITHPIIIIIKSELSTFSIVILFSVVVSEGVVPSYSVICYCGSCSFVCTLYISLSSLSLCKLVWRHWTLLFKSNRIFSNIKSEIYIFLST